MRLNPLSKKEKPETQKSLVRAEGRANEDVEELRDMNSEQQANGMVQFDFHVIDDEKILNLFDSTKKEYCPLLKPLLPLFSRLNFLTQFDERGLRSFNISVNIAIAQIKNQARTRQDYQLLENLRTFLHTQAYNSFMGFKIRVLTERKRTLIHQELEEERRGLLQSITGIGK
jgi:hypothetical protein